MRADGGGRGGQTARSFLVEDHPAVSSTGSSVSNTDCISCHVSAGGLMLTPAQWQDGVWWATAAGHLSREMLFPGAHHGRRKVLANTSSFNLRKDSQGRSPAWTHTVTR